MSARSFLWTSSPRILCSLEVLKTRYVQSSSVLTFEIYFVDFGIAQRFVQAKGEHKAFSEGSIVGTPTYLSANCHSGTTPSRRDDAEAVLYVLLHMLKGSLPWQNATSDAEGAKMKKTMSLDAMFQGLSGA